jgi:hypothetical protein
MGASSVTVFTLYFFIKNNILWRLIDWSTFSYEFCSVDFRFRAAAACDCVPTPPPPPPPPPPLLLLRNHRPRWRTSIR